MLLPAAHREQSLFPRLVDLHVATLQLKRLSWGPLLISKLLSGVRFPHT